MRLSEQALITQHLSLITDSGGLAQLARALDLHSRGQGFDSLILHNFFEITRYLRLRAEAKG